MLKEKEKKGALYTLFNLLMLPTPFIVLLSPKCKLGVQFGSLIVLGGDCQLPIMVISNHLKAISQCQQGIWCNKEPGDTIGHKSHQFVYRRNRNWCFSKVCNVKIKIPIQECY